MAGASGWMGKYIFCTVAVLVLHRMHTAVTVVLMFYIGCYVVAKSGNADSLYQENVLLQNKSMVSFKIKLSLNF